MSPLGRAVPSADSIFPGYPWQVCGSPCQGHQRRSFWKQEQQFPASQRIAQPAVEGSAEEQLGLAQAEGSVEQSYPAVAAGQSGE